MAKKSIFMLYVISVLTCVGACKSGVAEKTSVASQPMKVAGSVDGGDEIDRVVEDSDGGVEISPSTRFYFEAIPSWERQTLKFPEHRDQGCVWTLKKGYEPKRTYKVPACDLLWGDVTALIRINQITKRRYCENGVLQEYDDHEDANIDILRLFKGKVESKNLDVILERYPRDNTDRKVGEYYLSRILRTPSGKYIVAESLKAQLNWRPKPKPKPKPMTPEEEFELCLQLNKVERGGPFEIICRNWHAEDPFNTANCIFTDVPSTIGEFEERIKDMYENRTLDARCVRAQGPFSQRKEEFLIQSHGVPGEPCDIEKDLEAKRLAKEAKKAAEREEFEKWLKEREKVQKMYDEIDAIQGKKVPCYPNTPCPGGYMVEDLEIEEYLDRVQKIKDKWGKNE